MATNTIEEAEMPKYKCHKEVWALKIAEITEGTDGAVLTVADEGFGSVCVDGDYLKRHKPKVGGYYVVYVGGYKSFSPAKAFQAGYTRIPL